LDRDGSLRIDQATGSSAWQPCDKCSRLAVLVALVVVALQDADVRILIGRELLPILARALPPPRLVAPQAGATLRVDRYALAGDDLKL